MVLIAKVLNHLHNKMSLSVKSLKMVIYFIKYLIRKEILMVNAYILKINELMLKDSY
jgi:hypothetical protein